MPTPDTCPEHRDLVKTLNELTISLTKFTSNQLWIMRIGYGIFTIGLACLTMAVVAIFQAGGMSAEVQHQKADIADLKSRMTTIEGNLMGGDPHDFRKKREVESIAAATRGL